MFDVGVSYANLISNFKSESEVHYSYLDTMYRVTRTNLNRYPIIE